MGRSWIARRAGARGAGHGAPPSPSARWALSGLSLAMLLSSLGTSIANVGLPTLARAFDAPFQDVQWVLLSYLLAVTSLIVVIGRLGDLIGRRRLLLAGIALFTVASALSAAAPSLGALIAARVGQGAGGAAMLALAMALVRGSVPKAQAGRAIGLLGGMSAAGTALGPSLGGVLTSTFGWPALFAVNLPLGLLAFLLVQRHLPPDRVVSATHRAPLDVPGMLLFAATLLAYTLAMTLGRGTFGAVNAGWLLASAVGLGLFVRTESRTAWPLIRMTLFREHALSTGFAMSALVSTVMMSTLLIGPFHLGRALGLDTIGVGLAMTAGPLAAALAGVPAGRLADRFGASRMTIAGLVGMAGGACLLATLPTGLGIAGYVAPLVLLTVGYAVFQTANNTAVLTNVPADQQGVVSGMISLSRNLGLVTGASAMGALFAWATSSIDMAVASPDQVATGTRTSFAVAASLIGIAILLGVTSHRRSMAARSETDDVTAAA